MPSTALRGFNHVLDAAATRYTPRIYTIRTLRPRCSHASIRQRLQPRSGHSVKRHASFWNHESKDAHDGATESSPKASEKQYCTVEAQKLARSARRGEVAAWIAILELYLPASLRRGVNPEQPSLSAENQNPREIREVASLLAAARKYANVDLLSYLGVNQGRWDTVMWLVHSMVVEIPQGADLFQSYEQLPKTSWIAAGQTLDDITSERTTLIRTEHLHPPGHPIQRTTSMESLIIGKKNVVAGHQALGQIWQSLGSLVLQAEDWTSADETYHRIMAFVKLTLARLHHLDLLPASLYNYSPAKDPTVVQRPPTLFLLSTRIMSVLSDIEWRTYWELEMEKAKEDGYDLPPARVQPVQPHVGAEVWLELVLWACIEGGWVTEAGWIVAEIQKRKWNPNMQWSVISWEEICQTQESKPEWMAGLKMQIDKSRLNHATGINIASSGTSSVKMRPRSVSREVILAIIDGLINTSSSDNGAYGNSAVDVYQYIVQCKDLLKRDLPDFDTEHLNTIIVRILGSSGCDGEGHEGHVQLLLKDKLNQIKTSETMEAPISPVHGFIDQSAPILGLCHRLLGSFSRQSNLQGSLIALENIQSIVDGNRDVYIREFANELEERLRRGDEGSDLVKDNVHRTWTLLRPQIPMHGLVSFLELVTHSKYFDFGRWLLLNDDLDGGLIETRLYSDPNLQPSLLHFATSSRDEEVLDMVLQHLKPPLLESTLHALLRCQVVLGKWNAVNDFLEHFKKKKEMSWIPSDVTAIAAAILEMPQSEAEVHAKRILKGLLQGNFNSPQDASKMPEWTFIRTANQLARILQSTPGGTFSDSIPEGSLSRHGQEYNSTAIPASAFNVLLEAVTERKGCAAAKELWERWCAEPGAEVPFEDPVMRESGGRWLERVVSPELYLLRTVLRPIARTLRVEKRRTEKNGGKGVDRDAKPLLEEQDVEVLQWGVGMYKKFGLSWSKIVKAELPGVSSSQHLRRGKSL